MKIPKAVATFLALMISCGILSLAYPSLVNVAVISNTGLVAGKTMIAQSGSPQDIQTAINAVISMGGGTVYIPAGDWRVDQKLAYAYGYGGAIPIDLEKLPSGAWLNIIGLGGNTTVITQNGETLKNVPACILRSYICVDHIASYQSGADTSFRNSGNNLTSAITTFGIVGSNESSSNFNFVKSANRHIRISGLTILGDVVFDGNSSSAANTGISLQFVDGYLIDHCVIDGNMGSDVYSVYSKGVVSNCVIDDYYHEYQGNAASFSNAGVWGYGVQVGGNFGFYANGYGTPTWISNVSQIIGKYDWQGISLSYMTPVKGDLSTKGTTSSISYTAGPVYIENSQFNETRHCVSSSEYGYYVFRYNTVFGGVGLQTIDAHGGGWGYAANAYATRGCEIYDNFVNGNPGNGLGTATYSVMLRGGASLIFNNTFTNTLTGVELGNENYNSSAPKYPEYINDVWIWGNTFSGVTTQLQIMSGQGITAGVNYFSNIPSPTSPAPPKPGYMPYTYPHPLTLNGT